MSEEKGSVVCVGFMNGATMIGRLRDDNSLFEDAFFISLIRNPESRERNFCFKPVLTCATDQSIPGAYFASMLDSPSVLCMYSPAPSVLAAYNMFIDNDDLVGKIIYDSMFECGPSKEFVEKIMGEMPKPKPRVEDGVIKGVFRPTMVMIDDEEGQG